MRIFNKKFLRSQYESKARLIHIYYSSQNIIEQVIDSAKSGRTEFIWTKFTTIRPVFIRISNNREEYNLNAEHMLPNIQYDSCISIYCVEEIVEILKNKFIDSKVKFIETTPAILIDWS